MRLRRGLPGRVGRADSLPRASECCPEELPEERRRARRARLELGMELAGDEPGMVRELDDLDQPALLKRARHDEAGVDEPRPEVVVDLVAVPVALVDHRLAIGLARAGSFGDLD